MPFPKEVCDYTRRVQHNQCLGYVVTPDEAVKRCPKEIYNVHHEEPEGWVLAGNELFSDPNNGSTPCGLCEDHHDLQHPDLIEAKKAYRAGDKQAFHDMAKRHNEMARQGIIYWDDSRDAQLDQDAKDAMWRHYLETGEKRPVVRQHRGAKHHHWTDIVLGLRSYEEDEEK